MTQDLWDAVRESLGDHLGAARTKRTRQSSDALLLDAAVTLSQARDYPGADDAKTYVRPMPANARATLIEALRDAHRCVFIDGGRIIEQGAAADVLDRPREARTAAYVARYAAPA